MDKQDLELMEMKGRLEAVKDILVHIKHDPHAFVTNKGYDFLDVYSNEIMAKVDSLIRNKKNKKV